MLASDLQNPEFANPQNPDSVLHVEFYMHKPLDTWETQSTGIKTYLKEMPFVRIMIPGNKDSIVETPASPDHARRFKHQWHAFQMQQGMIANADDVPGWKLEDWSELTPDEVRNLKYLRFATVEQLAGASDAQVQGIGMGGPSLKARARAALTAKNSQEANSALKERDDRIAALERKLEAVLAMNEEKRKPGRPRNEDREAA